MPAAKDGRPRTPQGWKILKGDPYCRACKQTSYSLRAVIVPVVSPQNGSWAGLRNELRILWSETTRCANWLVSELYSRDVRREADHQSLPAMPHVYLYPEARALFPRLPSQAVSSLAQDVLRRYRSTRYEVLWTRARSLASYRYPVALTLPRQAWSLHEEQGQWIVAVRLSDSRWRLRLRGGAAMRRQSRRLRQIHDAEAERGSLTIYELRSGSGSARGAATGDVPRVMIKIAAWLPKVTNDEPRAGVVHAGPDEHSLLAADGQWRIDPAPIRRVLAADARRRSSLMTNLQSARAVRGRIDGLQRALDALSYRTNQRLSESCRTYAAHLVSHVVSAGAQEVRYDDRVRPKLSHFPWESLRRHVAQKLDERSIRFVYVPVDGDSESASSVDELLVG